MAWACVHGGPGQDELLPLHSKLQLGQPADETGVGKVMWLRKRILEREALEVGRELPGRDREQTCTNSLADLWCQGHYLGERGIFVPSRYSINGLNICWMN